MRLFSNRSQITSKCGKNKKVAHEPQVSVSLMSLRLSLALIRKNLTNIFKTTRYVEQNKENKFAVTSAMYLYSDRSWAMTNHSARSIQSLYNRKCKEISVENLCVGITAKRVKGYGKLRIRDNQGLSQLYIDLGGAKSEAPIHAF